MEITLCLDSFDRKLAGREKEAIEEQGEAVPKRRKERQQTGRGEDGGRNAGGEAVAHIVRCRATNKPPWQLTLRQVAMGL